MDIFSLLDSLQAIARDGLHYATNGFDRERYERLMQIATQAYSELLDAPAEAIKKQFLSETGYITPKVGTDAAIFNDRGEILLMERADGSGWCLPCGFVEPNETPVEAVIRETREETGLEIEVTQLVGVFTHKPSARMGPHTLVCAVHLCAIVSGEMRLSHEGLALRYWPLDEMKNWHANHAVYARAAYQMWNSDELIPAVSA